MKVSINGDKHFGGLNKWIKNLGALKGKAVYVGIPAEHNPAVEGADNFNMAALAAVLEFGAADKKIPSRPFLRQTLEKNRTKYCQLFAEFLENGVDSDIALERLAIIAKDDVQESIVTGNWVANKAATIKRKGSSKPLIDTGRLRQSIRGVVK